MQYMQCNLQGLYKWWYAPCKVSNGTTGQGYKNLAQTGKDVADIDITEKISSMVIDIVKARAGL
jgi:hypothetical protein